MTQLMTTKCDAPGCGKDITEGEGRRWRLVLSSEMIPLRADGANKMRHNAHTHNAQKHFCDFKCLAVAAMVLAERDETAQQATDALAAAAKARDAADETTLIR